MNFIPTLTGCAHLEQNICKQMAEIAAGIPFTKISMVGSKIWKMDMLLRSQI